MHALKLTTIAVIIISIVGCLVAFLISSWNVDEDKLCKNLLTDIERTEIASYQNLVNRIFRETTTGSHRGSTFRELSSFIDKFGNRIAGSENLENAIDYILQRSREESLENIHTEEVPIESWNSQLVPSVENGQIVIMSSFIKPILLLLLIKLINSSVVDNEVFDCGSYLTDSLREEIASYQAVVNKVVTEVVNGRFKTSTYNELADFVDKFGNRLAGTDNLERAIDYMLDRSEQKNLENVHGENAPVQIWTRGKESATLLLPRRQNLPLLGLGNSIGTPPDGITAEVLLVKSFDELKSRSEEAKGKIVIFAPDYITYGKTVVYRSKAASEAAKHGAVAALIRSIAPFSILSPHTGMQSYEENVTKIPVAALAVEDVHLIQRIQERGQGVKINLKMEASFGDIKTSRNTIAELKGSEHPEKVVIISGHLDSWDVGQGAMDDGGGAFISWNGLIILKALNLRPRRTIRTILWTAEEFGYVGAKQYYEDHKNETHNWNFIMESDEGTFNPYGLNYVSGDKGSCILKEVVKLFKPLNATSSARSDSVGSDINLWLDDGIPGAALLQDNEKYFWFHHSQGDTMDVEDPVSLDKNTALWIATAYIIADLKEDFPRD